MKIYNSFTDKYGNQYGFKTFIEFAQFWFNEPRKVLKSYFPDNFNALQKCAANSREARTSITVKN